MTPTATVCLISITENLPNGGYAAKTSTHIGLKRFFVTVAASPDLMDLGSSSISSPVLLSIFSNNLSDLHAMWAVAVQDWLVLGRDLARVIQDNHLGIEQRTALWGVVLEVPAHIPMPDLFDLDVLDVEPDVVAREFLDKSLVVHLNRLDLDGDACGHKGHHYSGLDDARFDSPQG